MPQRKSKNFFLYLFLFLILGTIHNLDLKNIDYLKVKNIKITGLEKIETPKLYNNLSYLKLQNLFFLNKSKIDKILMTNSSIENYSAFRIFPSTLKIDIKKTNILANTYKDGSNFLIGTNGKLIKTNKIRNDKPFVFGNFKNDKFLEFKKTVDKSKLKFTEIKKIYFFDSGRWDIEMIDGIIIRLPQKKLEDALNLSFNLIAHDEFKKVGIIDIRVKNQVIINE